MAVFVGLYDFDKTINEELSFRKGEHLEILCSKRRGWWFARSLKTNKRGYIPNDYIAPDNNYVAPDNKWLPEKINRADAESKLLTDGISTGTFLVREVENSNKVAFVLSVRYIEEVKHFAINKFNNGWLCMESGRVFSGLHELVSFYRQDADDLPCMLSCNLPDVELPVEEEALISKEIERESLQLTRNLGAGEFYKIRAGYLNGTTEVIVNIKRWGTYPSLDFLQEVEIMQKLTHKNVVQLLGVCSKVEPFYIVTESMCHGILQDFLHISEGKRLELKDIIDAGTQIASGMRYMEEVRCIHRDIAARNVLVGGHYVYKITGFHFAKILDKDDILTDTAMRMPVRWAAPESARKGQFSIKSDVWSFGILLVELVTKGMLPYAVMRNAEVLKAIKRGYKMECPTDCPAPLYEIILKCWKSIPKDRPTFEFLHGILEDYFVATEKVHAEVLDSSSHLEFDDKQSTLQIQTDKVLEAGALALSEWKLKKKSLHYTAKLEERGCHEVWSGVWNDTIKVAIKRSTKSSCDIFKGAECASKLRHQHLVQLYGIYCEKGSISVVTEFMSHGSLLDFLQKGDGQRLQMRDLIDSAAQIASGMRYMEKEGYIYLDLAARSILVGGNYVYKIGNVGCIRAIDDYQCYYDGEEHIFPIKWTPPEAAIYECITTKSNVWSFGVLLTEVITKGKAPYPDMTDGEVLTQVERGYRMHVRLVAPCLSMK